MSVPVILDEMIVAGEEAYSECEEAGADRKTTVLQIYASMEAVRVMMFLDGGGSIH